MAIDYRGLRTVTARELVLKTLKSIVETQTRWTEEDLKRLKLVR